MHEHLKEDKGRSYVAFVDMIKAFDRVNRSILMNKVMSKAGRTWLTRLVMRILQENYIQIDNNIHLSKQMEQNIGVLQGDPISALLFTVMLYDIAKITKDTAETEMYIYADDIAIVSKYPKELQKALNALSIWVEENELDINIQKTEVTIFRKGGKIAKSETFAFKGEPLTITNRPCYLGVTIQTTGRCFGMHLTRRITAAVHSMSSIQHLSRMSIDTAMKLFKAKVMPIATYGISLTWPYLTKKQMKDLEKIKAVYLKKILCISKYTPSRYAYVLAKETFFLEDLKLTFLLPETRASKDALQERLNKQEEIEENFYNTDAMVVRDWTLPDYELRHVVTRYAVHGFHHRICKTKSFHTPCDKCKCSECGKVCGKYHIMECKRTTKTIVQLAKE